MVKSPEANDNNQEALFEIAVPAQDTVSLVGSVCLNKTVVDAASMHTVTTGPSKPSDADIARANTLFETGQISSAEYRDLIGEDDTTTPPAPVQPVPPNTTPKSAESGLSTVTRGKIMALRESFVQKNDKLLEAQLRKAGYSDETIARQFAARQMTRQLRKK